MVTTDLRYKYRIIIALDALGDHNGSSFDSIKEHVQEQLRGEKWLNTTFNLALKKLVNEGDLDQTRSLYKLSQAFLDHRAYLNKKIGHPNPLYLDENGKWSKNLYEKARRNNMSDEAKAKVKAKNKARWDNMSDEAKAKVYDAQKARRRERYHTEPGFKERSNQRSRQWKEFQNIDEGRPAHTCNMLGLEQINQDFSDFHRFLHDKTDEGLTYQSNKNKPDNEKVDMDHVACISAFDLSDPRHVRVAFHFTNTQLLLANINQHVKGNKLPPGFNIERHVDMMIEQIDLIEENGWSCQQVLSLQKQGKIFGYVPLNERWWLNLI